jgi:hypothetical protein
VVNNKFLSCLLIMFFQFEIISYHIIKNEILVNSVTQIAVLRENNQNKFL